MCKCCKSMLYEMRCQVDSAKFAHCRCRKITLVDTLLYDSILLGRAVDGDFTWLTTYCTDDEIPKIVKRFYKEMNW